MNQPKASLIRGVLILSFNLLLLLLGILILEYFFGNWRLDNGLIRLSVRQNVDEFVDLSDLQDVPKNIQFVHYKRDQNGLRGPFKDVASLDILTVGGSTTDQVEIPEGETWQDIVANRFRQDGKEIQIANAGIGGQSVYGHVRNFKLWFRNIPDLKAKYVLAYVAINDICVDPDFFEDYMAEGEWTVLFKKRSALYLIYRKILGIYQYLRSERYNSVHSEDVPEDKISWTDQALVANPETVFRENVKAYKKRLRLLLKRIREFHAIPIFVTQRTYSYYWNQGKILGVNRQDLCHNTQINGVDEYHLMNLFNRATLDLCREENLTCFDLAGELDFEEDDFYDLMHNTPSGSRKIGEYFYKKLKPLFE